MKLSTKIAIANELAKEIGGGPRISMAELHTQLTFIKASSRAQMREKIRKQLFCQ